MSSPRVRVVCRHEGTRREGRTEDFIVELEDARTGPAGEIVVGGRGWTTINYGVLQAELRESGPRGVTARRAGVRNGRTLSLSCRRCSRSAVIGERQLGRVLDALYRADPSPESTTARTVTVRLVERALGML